MVVARNGQLLDFVFELALSDIRLFDTHPSQLLECVVGTLATMPARYTRQTRQLVAA